MPKSMEEAARRNKVRSGVSSKKLRHLHDVKRGSHTSSQHKGKKAKTRGTKGAFGNKRK